MEQQEMQEERRARNFVWAAAEQYGLEPLFLAYAPDGTADMYLNIIIGLSYKWYDAKNWKHFFICSVAGRRNCIRGCCGSVWNRHYTKKEQAHRPALTDLRQEYAQENLGRYRSFKEYELIDQLRNGHCAAILGQGLRVIRKNGRTASGTDVYRRYGDRTDHRQDESDPVEIFFL